jgi:hypothetical protein
MEGADGSKQRYLDGREMTREDVLGQTPAV